MEQKKESFWGSLKRELFGENGSKKLKLIRVGPMLLGLAKLEEDLKKAAEHNTEVAKQTRATDNAAKEQHKEKTSLEIAELERLIKEAREEHATFMHNLDAERATAHNNSATLISAAENEAEKALTISHNIHYVTTKRIEG